MKRAIILLIVMSLMAPVTVLAAGGGSSFWSSLKSRIQGITPKKQANVTTAVGGVRGALSDEAADVYWKGKDVNEVDEVELQKFNDALNLAVQGEEKDSLKAFEAFLIDYPDSTLRPDALEAVETLKSSAASSQPKAETKSSEKNVEPAPAAPSSQ